MKPARASVSFKDACIGGDGYRGTHQRVTGGTIRSVFVGISKRTKLFGPTIVHSGDSRSSHRAPADRPAEFELAALFRRIFAAASGALGSDRFVRVARLPAPARVGPGCSLARGPAPPLFAAA